MKIRNLAFGLAMLLCSIGKGEMIYQTDISNMSPMSTSNAMLENDNGISYWKTIDSAQQAEIIYKIDFPNQGLWSLTWFNSSIASDNISDYLITYAGRSGEDWRKIDQAGLGKSYKNFVRDTTYGSISNSHMYLRTIFSGNSARIFQSGAYVRVSVVPECSILVMLVPFLFIRGYRNEI